MKTGLSIGPEKAVLIVVLGLMGIALLRAALPLVRGAVWRAFGFDADVREVLGRAKSSEVRVGRITESMAPLLDGFPVDVRRPGTTTHFIGRPVDFVYFDPDRGIVFVEVKSGNAGLSTAQRRLRDAVLSGRVYWEEFRLEAPDPDEEQDDGREAGPAPDDRRRPPRA